MFESPGRDVVEAPGRVVIEIQLASSVAIARMRPPLVKQSAGVTPAPLMQIAKGRSQETCECRALFVCGGAQRKRSVDHTPG
jgi:hypothetical protein